MFVLTEHVKPIDNSTEKYSVLTSLFSSQRSALLWHNKVLPFYKNGPECSLLALSN